jgi:hypothetical protein
VTTVDASHERPGHDLVARQLDQGRATSGGALVPGGCEPTRGSDAEKPPETGYVQPGLIETQLAEASIGMRDLDNALQYAERAVSLTTHPRAQVNRLVTVTKVALAGKNLV